MSFWLGLRFRLRTALNRRAADDETRAELAYHVETDGPVRIDFSDGRHVQLDAAGMHEGTL